MRKIKKGVQMTAQKILKMIEEVDPSDERKMDEVWLPIFGYKGKYEVSSFGRVRSLERVVSIGVNKRKISEKILSPKEGSSGYFLLTLHGDNGQRKSVNIHRIVAAAFLGGANGLIVRHKDNNKKNNSIENLEYGTHKQNTEDRIKHGTMNYGESVHNSRLSIDDVLWIKSHYIFRDSTFGTIAMSKKFNVSPSTISAVLHERNWKWLKMIEYERSKC